MADQVLSDHVRYALEFSALTFVGVLILIVLTVWIVRITLKATPAPSLRDQIEEAREHIAEIRADNRFDHEQMAHQLKETNGRLQFLLAKEIAAELMESRRVAKPKDTDPKGDPPS